MHWNAQFASYILTAGENLSSKLVLICGELKPAFVNLSRFNLRPAGEGVFEHPLRFFADSKKTATRSAAGFSPTLSPICLATFVKVSILGHARSGHQVRSSDHTLQKVYNRATATVFGGRL